MDEPENLKMARTLAVGSSNEALGAAFNRGKHFVWLEKGGYDVGVLLANGAPASTIVPVTDDPDLAMLVQDKFTDVRVICGDPLELVRREGRVFASMSLGFHRPFTREFFDQIILFLQYGAREGTFFYFAINGGEPSGEEILEEGHRLIKEQIEQTAKLGDLDVVADYLSTPALPQRSKVRELTITVEGFSEAVRIARDFSQKAAESLESLPDTKDGRASTRFFSFLRYFRDSTWMKKMGAMPYKVHVLERKSKQDHEIIFMSHLLRGKVGERVDKFAVRLSNTMAKAGKPLISMREDRDGLIQDFFKANKGLSEKNPKIYWDLYFSQDTKLSNVIIEIAKE